MQILWTRAAALQLRAAIDYVSQDKPAAAEKQLNVIQRAVEQLTDFPEIGREGRIDGTRELVITGTPYIVAYRIRQKTVRVLAILHGARRWPAQL